MATYIILEIWTFSRVTHTEKKHTNLLKILPFTGNSFNAEMFQKPKLRLAYHSAWRMLLGSRGPSELSCRSSRIRLCPEVH